MAGRGWYFAILLFQTRPLNHVIAAKVGIFVTTMTREQRATLELIFSDLDDAVAELLEDTMNSVPGIGGALDAVRGARNTINGMLLGA